jgi:hypothetical protein
MRRNLCLVRAFTRGAVSSAEHPDTSLYEKVAAKPASQPLYHENSYSGGPAPPPRP